MFHAKPISESGYWGKLVLNTVSFNIPLLRCLTRIRDDILSVWNLNDPEEVSVLVSDYTASVSFISIIFQSLKGVDFNTEMFKLIKPLLQKSGSPPWVDCLTWFIEPSITFFASRDTLEKSNGVADLAGKISPGLEKALAYAGLLGVVANVLLDRIEERCASHRVESQISIDIWIPQSCDSTMPWSIRRWSYVDSIPSLSYYAKSRSTTTRLESSCFIHFPKLSTKLCRSSSWPCPRNSLQRNIASCEGNWSSHKDGAGSRSLKRKWNNSGSACISS